MRLTCFFACLLAYLIACSICGAGGIELRICLFAHSWERVWIDRFVCVFIVGGVGLTCLLSQRPDRSKHFLRAIFGAQNVAYLYNSNACFCVFCLEFASGQFQIFQWYILNVQNAK